LTTLPAYCEVIDPPRLCGVEFRPLTRFKEHMPGAGDICDALHCTAAATAACDPDPDHRTWFLFLCNHHRQVYRANYHRPPT
jgi:hypothetical protein